MEMYKHVHACPSRGRCKHGYAVACLHFEVFLFLCFSDSLKSLRSLPRRRRPSTIKMLVSFGLYSEFLAETRDDALHLRGAVSSGELGTGFPSSGASLPEWSSLSSRREANTSDPSVSSFLLRHLLPREGESSLFFSQDEAHAVGPEGRLERRDRRSKTQSEQPQVGGTWCLSEQRDWGDASLACQLYEEDLAFAAASSASSASAGLNPRDVEKPDFTTSACSPDRGVKQSVAGAASPADSLDPSQLAGVQAKVDAVGPSRDLENSRGRTFPETGGPGGVCSSQPAGEASTRGLGCSDTSGPDESAAGVAPSLAFQQAAKSGAPQRRPDFQQNPELGFLDSEVRRPLVAPREESKTQEAHPKPPLSESGFSCGDQGDGDACPFWCVWTRGCFTTKPAFSESKRASLLEEAEAFVARAASGALAVAAGKAADLRLRQTPRHLALYVAQVSSRMFFDPQYRAELMNKYG
ncbi:hypothetical protein TGCAST_306530 [Toxoplasma gondii CAST]|uniref:Uncharacterized protein n=1 Tax=Toxoplasma gondii CAST TaxID=943122 RepID=A0A425HPQ9_TOXGO|nr:hypothetical protein TGCAST_306530 [Toxoplasma gondii CAST]